MLVTAIMPTANRRKYIPRAIECFLNQTYTDSELLIVDDGDPVVDLVPVNKRIRYCATDKAKTLGDKRNLCCELARGSVIAHWDDDDWSAPERLSDQVARLGPSEVTGYNVIMFYDERNGQAYRFESEPNSWIVGTSLCYRKDWWNKHPFESLKVGEDTSFYKKALSPLHNTLSAVDGRSMMVASIHDNHTSPRNEWHPQYKKVDHDQLPQGFHAYIGHLQPQ